MLVRSCFGICSSLDTFQSLYWNLWKADTGSKSNFQLHLEMALAAGSFSHLFADDLINKNDVLLLAPIGHLVGFLP